MDVGTNVWVRYIALQKDKTPANHAKISISANSKYRSSSSSSSSSSTDAIDENSNTDYSQYFSLKTVSWLGAVIKYKVRPISCFLDLVVINSYVFLPIEKKLDCNGVVSVTANLVEPYSMISSKREFTFQ